MSGRLVWPHHPGEIRLNSLPCCSHASGLSGDEVNEWDAPLTPAQWDAVKWMFQPADDSLQEDAA